MLHIGLLALITHLHLVFHITGAAEPGRQLPTQLLVVAIEPCMFQESSLVALVFQDHFWMSLEIP